MVSCPVAEPHWEPLLVDGPLADAARDAVRAIGSALAARDIPSGDAAGVTLFWAYAAGATDDPETDARYGAAIDRLIGALGESGRGPQLYGGLAGDAWVLAHVGSSGGEELLARIDAGLVRILRERVWSGDYDLIVGVVGLGIYFLERLESEPGAPHALEGLAVCLQFFDDTREDTPAGTTWLTRPELLVPWQRAIAPAGIYNCGLAHGVPGVIALLGRLAEHGQPLARALLDDAQRWLWTQRLPAGSDAAGWFPSMLVAGRPADPARTAWCYGDPGIAVASWSAARRTGAAEADARALALAAATEADARTLALAAATRDPAACGVRDAGLCHGAAGLAHLYNRCFQASGDPLFRDAALLWLSRTLSMRSPDHGIAGFAAWTAAPRTLLGDTVPEPAWHPLDGFLEGVAGIGLALLAALGSLEPGWDRLLACDLPPRPAP